MMHRARRFQGVAPRHGSGKVSSASARFANSTRAVLGCKQSKRQVVNLRKKSHPRRETISFDTDGFVAGWVFGVPEAFREALDLRGPEQQATGQSSLPRTWVRRVPPHRDFKVGDVFYDPPKVRRLMWRDALKSLRRSVQIKKAKPETVDRRAGTGINPGSVTFTVTEWKRGKPKNTTSHTTTQAGFEELLRSGDRPKGTCGGAPDTAN